MAGLVALYRESKFGDCLVNSLDELVHAGKLPPPLALRVLEEVLEDDVLDTVFLLWTHMFLSLNHQHSLTR